jgi:hypothetical protein
MDCRPPGSPSAGKPDTCRSRRAGRDPRRDGSTYVVAGPIVTPSRSSRSRAASSRNASSALGGTPLPLTGSSSPTSRCSGCTASWRSAGGPSSLPASISCPSSRGRAPGAERQQPERQADRGYDEGEVCLPPEEMVCEAPPEEMVCEAPPQEGHDRGMGAGDHARSVGEHVTRTALHEAALREMYHRVAAAPSVDRPRVMAREAGRVGGALAGEEGGR